jgi:hypothetical protein
MKALLVFVACIIIVLNTVPRLNDTHFSFREVSVRKWFRFLGLTLTAASSLWLCYAVSVPSSPFAAESVVALLCGVAVSWTTSPLVGNWMEFVFHIGGDQRYENLKRRKEDSA